MAVEFEIVQENNAELIDLWNGPYKLIEKTWTTSNPWPEGDYRHVEFGAQAQFSHYPPQDEAFSLVVKDSEANIFAAQKALEAAFNDALQSNTNPLRPDFMWLKATTSTESSKRSLIYKGMCAFPPRDGVNFLLDGVPSAVLIAALSLERHPFWESMYGDGEVADYPQINDSSMGSVGDFFTYSNLPGTAPARIVRGGAGTDDNAIMTKLWLGIREKYADTASFNARHECENASLVSGGLYFGAAVVADVTASSGNKVDVPFNVKSTFDIRLDTRFGDIGFEYSRSMMGRYSVLMRAKVTTGATVRVQLRYGSAVDAGSTKLQPRQDVYISDADWNLYELGEVQIPAHEVFSAIDGYSMDNTYFRLQLWAEHITGTAATDILECDTFVFIPSEHMIRITGARIAGGIYLFDTTQAYVLPNDLILALNLEDGAIPNFVDEFAPRQFYIPEGDGLVVAAAQRENESVLTDTLNVSLRYAPRWMSYRDA